MVQNGDMEINWRDMLSMIISPELFFLFSVGHSVAFFLQQVGASAFLTSDAEEVNDTNAVPMAMINVAMNSRLIFFMVVVLSFRRNLFKKCYCKPKKF